MGVGVGGEGVTGEELVYFFSLEVNLFVSFFLSFL